MQKIDKTARQILFLLDCNSRASSSTIAKKLGIPEATARYRIRALFDQGIIQQAYPVFRPGRVGMSIHKFMFKLHKADETTIARFSDSLVANQQVNWVARFDGHFDVGCTLLVRQIGELSKFIDGVRRRFSGQVRQLSYAINIEADFFPRDYLVRDKRAASSSAASYRSYLAGEREIEIDQTDWVVLQAVASNPRVSAVEIAQQAGIAPETASRRLNLLEKQKVIGGYRLALNSHAINRTSYYLLLYLNFVSEERLAKLLQYLRSHAAVVYIIKMLGEWDYDISIELKDAVEYRAFITALMQQFSDVIKDLHTLTTWQVGKFGILPAGGEGEALGF